MIVRFLPIKWQVLIAINRALRKYGHTSHYRLEAYRMLRESSGLPLGAVRVLIDKHWPDAP